MLKKSLFSDFFDGVTAFLRWNGHIEVPAMNVVETDKDFLLEMAAPGKHRDDFKIEVGDNSLSDQLRKGRKEENEPRFRRKEFSYNYFRRTFSLPSNCLPLRPAP